MKKTISILAALLVFLSACTAATAENKAIIIDNPTLTEWAIQYTVQLLLMQKEGNPVEHDTGNGSILSYEQNIRYGANGERVLDGGLYSENGIYTLGMGAGVDRDDLWYVTLTFGSNADPKIVANNTRCMICAFEDLDKAFSESDETKAIFEEILAILTQGNGDVGFEINGKLLMRKELGNGLFIVGVDSVTFYNAFYAGSLKDYYTLSNE